jgi:archaellum biogenesis protein FlaJ (TadC family)
MKISLWAKKNVNMAESQTYQSIYTIKYFSQMETIASWHTGYASPIQSINIY